MTETKKKSADEMIDAMLEENGTSREAVLGEAANHRRKRLPLVSSGTTQVVAGIPFEANRFCCHAWNHACADSKVIFSGLPVRSVVQLPIP